ncbi:probable ATP-dependent RNA helicase DDX28 [Diorhabda sublineata]|uniref:probable ATP-dependent RNA helicase DDX28 n=1 Tax=Diorhabda sublineata TaxID=1163346 RepID=UPI0024E15283|nr:probable ATP-dependent RNA helicase DDX28 [Diorhabda sublineata]
MLTSSKVLFKHNAIKEVFQSAFLSQAVPKLKKKGRDLLISCKRSNLNHYAGVYYSKLDEVPLASKGWAHSKSRGDVFTVNKLEDVKTPTYSFQDVGIHTSLIPVLKNLNIKTLTEFQYRAINEIRLGYNAMIAAETGCGKTLSYLLPIVQDLINKKSENPNTPRAVVIVPNRELTYQVGEIAELLGKAVGVVAKTVVGGKTKALMMNPVFEDIDILVATPGALGKLSTVGIYKLNEVKFTVLDEADTLIDDSFVDRMESLIKRMPQSQILLVSATIPRKLPPVFEPIEMSLRHVVSPKIHKPLLNITQKFLRLTKSSKPGYLLQLAKANTQPMLIFSNKNETCNWVALFLRENGINCANINGDMNYFIRIDQWNRFAGGEVKILSATDVGSRGLNTVQVRHVLNYDFPLYAADYLHRIGRVGRLGSSESCKVTNFVAGLQEVKMVQQIELAIRRNEPLENVDGNITNLVQRKIERNQREAA